MNLKDIGIIQKTKDVDLIQNKICQNTKASSILKINSIEVFKAVDFLIDEVKEDGKAIINKNMSILDIGTRIGSAIKRFNQRGFAKTKGIDLSPGAIKNALKYKFNVWEEDIVYANSNDFGFYHVIFCRHVLEHVTNLELALLNMNNKLTDNGILFLIVPLYTYEQEIIPTHNFNFVEPQSLLKLVCSVLDYDVLFYDIRQGSEEEMWLIARKK